METGSQIRPSAPDTSVQIKNTLGLLPVIALSAALTGPAYAQAQESSQNAGSDVRLGQINVEAAGSGSANAVEQDTNVGRIPGKVKDVPQVVNVITPEVMEQQQTQTLEQVLRTSRDALAARVMPMSALLTDLPAVTLRSEAHVERVKNGVELGPADLVAPLAPLPPVARMLAPDGRLVALAKPGQAGGFLHGWVVLG